MPSFRTSPTLDADAAGDHRFTTILLSAIAVAGAAIVYYPITRNYFHEDDFLHLYQIANFRRFAFLLYPHAGHLYLARNAIFMLFAQCFGAHAAAYYWAAFLTHLINVGLCFLVIHRLTRSPRLAAFGATLWGVSQLNEGAVGWYSVYGQVVAGTAILLILRSVADAAARGAPPERRQRWAWYGLALVAATSFGTGLGVALALPLAIAILVPRPPDRGLLRTPLLSLLVVLPVLHAVLLRLWTASTGRQAVALPVFSGSYGELAHDALPAFLHLLTYANATLLLGFLAPLVEPTGWFSLALGLLVAAAAVATLLPRERLRERSGGGPIWAVGWRRPAALDVLLIANYASIALGRSFLVVTLGDQFAATARYHYTGAMLLAIFLCTVLARWAEWVPLATTWKNAVLAAWFAIAAAGYVARPPVYDHHSEERRRAEEVLTAIRTAIAAAPPGGDAYIANGRFNASWLWHPADFPGWAGLFVVVYPDNVVDGRRVHFVTENRNLLTAAREGRRSATLFVDRIPPSTEPAAPPPAGTDAGPR